MQLHIQLNMIIRKTIYIIIIYIYILLYILYILIDISYILYIYIKQQF